jgi:uncharacterized protein (UPF0261 family)
MEKELGNFIVILGTLDTKSQYIHLLRDEIVKRDHTPIVMDLSMRSEVEEKGDITPEEIAKAAGVEIEEVRGFSERDKITRVMTLGAAKKSNELYLAGKLNGVIGIGGITAALVSSRIMQELPFGIPKLIVTSCAALRGFASRIFGSRDIVLMYSMIDFVGLNELLKDILIRSAGAICGMVSAARGIMPSLIAQKGKKLVAMSVMGTVQRCAEYINEQMNSLGYEIVSFAADGPGDMAMENLIEGGFFEFVIDLCPGAVGEEILGGTRTAGPARLEAAGEKGIPEIIVPSAVNIMTPPKSRYKPEYAKRKQINLDELRTWIRLSAEEMRMVAKVFAEKLNKAKGEVRFLNPLKGWGSLDTVGSSLYDPGEDKIFIEELKKYLKPEIPILEIDANADELEFAKAVVSSFKEMKRKDIL